jgi:hypothetical protein
MKAISGIRRVPPQRAFTFQRFVGKRLERHGLAPQIERMLHRHGVLVLAFAFVVGLTAQIAAGVWTMNGCPTAMGSMSAPSGDPPSDVPCNGLTLACIDGVNCAMPTALPVPPMAASISFEWTAASFTLIDTSMSGLSLEPDLTPPILNA